MSVTVSVMVQKNHGAENSSLTTGSFESLMEARDGARQMKKEASDENAAIEITVPQGRHEIDMPLQLKPEDSGSETAPVTWKAEQGAEVILSGGHLLENAEAVQDKAIFKHLTAEARLRVVQFDLKDEGVPDFGHATASGERPELFIDGDPMPLAGWPNDGFTTVKNVLGIEPFDVRGTRGDRVGKFVYRESRPERWQDEADPWLHGYWFWDWSDEYQRIASIDTDRKIIELEKPYHNYGYRPGMRYRAVNMLCELDSPGEWYIDRDKGVLYLWPPRPVESLEVILSVRSGLLEIQGISHVRLEGLTFEGTRECPLTISESENVEVKNCEIRNVGGDGVIVKGGTDNAIVGCHIRNPGRGGITLQGGDRPSLTHANHRAEDNHIHHFSRVDRTYTPAVNVSGVGHTVRGNLIHHAPHNGIQLSGNEHVIEDNELHHLCQETGDVGAFYAGRDWTERGTVLEGNFFHHIAGPGQVGAMGVYLDDAASGFTVRGNVFWKVTRAAFIGGGRDNIFENNIFIDCERAIHVDARGMNWMSY
ncbi:MAG: right-handed parallel beta-helix repeat-containing protein, partial [Planctomycetes bacterium]|nr:right-handed parallel beta-helix repeat-containing protein [Planctomycetota bacterium]